MGRKKSLRLIIGVILVAVLATALPLTSGCAAPVPAPTPEPTPTPTPTPTPEPEPAAEQPIYNWRLITNFAEDDAIIVVRQFAREVEIATQGRVHIEDYWASELVPFSETVPACRAGTVEMANWSGCLGAFTDGGSALDVIGAGIPFGWGNAIEAEVIYQRRGLMEVRQDAWHEYGLHCIGMISDDVAQNLIAKQTITDLDWFQGKKMKAHTGVVGLYETLGATVIEIPDEEMYLAAQTGVVDCMHWGGSVYMSDMGMHEVMPYFNGTSFKYPVLSEYLINLEVWNSLPEDIQMALTLAARSGSIRRAMRTYDLQAERRGLFEGVWYWTDEQVEVVRDIYMDTWDEMAQTSPRSAAAIEILRAFQEEFAGLKFSLR